MKNKFNFLKFALPLMVIVISVFVFLNKTKIPKELKIALNHYKENESKSNGKDIGEVEVIDYLNNVYKIESLVDTDSNYLFFYTKDSDHCKPCVDETIELIKTTLSNEYKMNSLIILMKFSSQNSFSTFKRLNKLKGFKVFGLKGNNLEIPMESLNVPMFFTLKKGENIKNSKAVMKQLPDRTIEYLKNYK